MIGEYVATYRSDHATLTLNADRTYKHVIKLKDGQILVNDGTWETHGSDQGQQRTRIEFFKFRVIPSYLGEKREEVGWSTEVERDWLARIQLCFDSDVGYCYIKR
jgi:hypothetical protein